MIKKGKRSKTLNEVKQVKNISKNLLRFLEISPVQKEILPLHKLQDHAKEDNPLKRNCQNQLIHQSLLYIEQECQESLIQGEFHISQTWYKDLSYC